MKNHLIVLNGPEKQHKWNKWCYIKPLTYFIACMFIGYFIGIYYLQECCPPSETTVSLDPLAQEYTGTGTTIQYPDTMILKKTTGELDLYLRNPKNSKHSIQASVYLQESELTETGWLSPGSQRTQFMLTDQTMLETLEPGSYPGSIEMQEWKSEDRGETITVPITIQITDESTENAEILKESLDPER